MLNPETYQAVYHSYPDAVVLVDYFGIIVLANGRANEMFGYDEGELLGYSVETLMPATFSKAHQKHRETYLNNPEKKSIKNGRVFKALKKNNVEFSVEVGLSTLKIGKKNLVAAFVKDVTVRENLETRFHKMVEEILDYAIVFLDVHGNIINWNKGVERITGYQESEIVGQNFQMFYSEKDQLDEVPEKHLDIAVEFGRSVLEGWRMRKDGSLFWASAVITTIKDDHGFLIGFSKITRDLTERKKAEESLKKQSDALLAKNGELENFAYIASHDLQEPLSTIAGMIELIRHGTPEGFEEEIESYFTFIEGAVDRMHTLIECLLEYSRLGRNKKLTKVSISDMIADVKADLGTRIQSTQAKITVGPMPELAVYNVEFRLLFQNLISNALKFSLPGKSPEVSITAQEYGSYWRFLVSDNGIGIQEQNRDKIFIIFQKLNKPGMFPGNGIGLAHCKKIVEMHEGNIWVESEPGKGSSFYFTISKQLKKL